MPLGDPKSNGPAGDNTTLALATLTCACALFPLLSLTVIVVRPGPRGATVYEFDDCVMRTMLGSAAVAVKLPL